MKYRKYKWGLRDRTASALKYPGRNFIAVAIMAVALLILFSVYFKINYSRELEVNLEVNPYVTLDVNSKNEVIRVRANNAEGAKVLAGLELDGVQLEVAIDMVMGAIINDGYIQSPDQQVGLLVSGKTPENIRAKNAIIRNMIDLALEGIEPSADTE